MNSDEPQLDLTQAFDLLINTIRDLRGRNRRTLMQGVKPIMQRTSMGNFSEYALGFETFSAFVHAAEERGLVVCRPEMGGVSLHLPGEPPTHPVAPKPRKWPSTSRKMRADLWVAFVDWDQGYLRAWDRAAECALRVPVEKVPLETSNQAALRDAITRNDSGFARIEPIGVDRQLDWMRVFAAQHENHPLGPALNATLAPSADLPVRAFAQTLRADPKLKARWNAQRLALVAERVVEWAHDNDVNVPIWEDVGVVPAGDHVPQSAERRPMALPTATAEVEELRAVIHRAVDRMDRADLLRLPLSLELLVDELA